MKSTWRIVSQQDTRDISLEDGKIIIVKKIVRKNKTSQPKKRIIVHTFERNAIDKLISSNACHDN